MAVSARARRRLNEISMLRAERTRERADLRRAVSAAEVHDISFRIATLNKRIDALLTGRTADVTRVVWLDRQ